MSIFLQHCEHALRQHKVARLGGKSSISKQKRKSAEGFPTGRALSKLGTSLGVGRGAVPLPGSDLIVWFTAEMDSARRGDSLCVHCPDPAAFQFRDRKHADWLGDWGSFVDKPPKLG